MNTTTTPTFTVGQLVSARAFGDQQAVWVFEVVARSAKFVTLEDSDGKRHRVAIRKSDIDGGEFAMPFGRYSMAPVVRA